MDKSLARKIFHATKKNLVEEESDTPIRFKAFFVVGGPGSGKDRLLSNITEAYNLREVTLGSVQKGVGIADRAGLVITANAYNVQPIVEAKELLEAIGYDTMMVFVMTSAEASRQRTKMVVEEWDDKWRKTVESLPTYENAFGLNSFVAIDNTDQPVVMLQYEAIGNFVEKPLQSPAAHVWIADQMTKIRLKAGENLDDLLEAVEYGQATNDTYRKDTPGQPATSNVAVDGGMCDVGNRDTIPRMEGKSRLQEILERAAQKIMMVRK